MACIRQLRSADTQILVVSQTRDSFGDRTSAAAGPQVWNSLPPNLRLCGLSHGQSVQAVNEDIFIWTVRPRCSVNYFNCAEQKYPNSLTYLLTRQSLTTQRFNNYHSKDARKLNVTQLNAGFKKTRVFQNFNVKCEKKLG